MTARKKRLKPDNKKQSARFIKTAERIIDDDSGKKFEEVIDKIIGTKQKKTKKVKAKRKVKDIFF